MAVFSPSMIEIRFAALLALMLCSGLAGISYEVLYARLLGNLIGDQFVVSAAILMTFLLGIGLGSLFAHRLLRFLWAIEAGIAFYALGMVWAQPWLESLLYGSGLSFFASLSGGVLFCVGLLIVPAVLIGCSVPLFSAYLARFRRAEHETAFSRVYMVYNVGAVCTALGIEFWLIRWLGIQQAVLSFAALNLLVAVGLWLGYRLPSVEAERVERWWAPLRGIGLWQWLPLVFASIASAVLQLFMMKYAELVFGPFRESFALVLSIVLLGIVFGAWGVRWWRLSFSHWMLLAILGLLWMLVGAGGMIYFYAAIYEWIQPSYVASVLGKWVVLFVLMIVPVTAFGATIPALLSNRDEVSRESGALLFISACANALGFLLMVFLLHPLLDYGVQLLVVLALSVLAWLLASGERSLLWRRTLGALVVLVCVLWIYPRYWDEDLLYLSYTNYQDVEDLRESRQTVSFPDRYKGYQDVFSINWMDGKPYFFINGYISIPLNNSSEKVVGALSTAYAPNLNKALVLGLGSGATASTVGLFFDHTDVVEINPVVRENLYRMARWNYDIEHNPKVDIVVDDAIHYMKAGKGRYSLILNTVTTPLYFSSSKLYTTDFLASVKRRLRKDGIYVTWMDSRIGDEGADIILRTMRSQFSYCALLYIKSAYFLLIGSDRPIQAWQREQVAAHPMLRHDLMERYGMLSDWLPYQLLTTRAYALIGDADGPVNSANNPVLEYAMAHLRSKRIDALKQRLIERMDLSQIRRATQGSDVFPADMVLHAERKIRRSSLYRELLRLAREQEAYPRRALLAELYRRRIRAEELQAPLDWYRYGRQAMRAERHEEAVHAFDVLLALQPSYNNAHYYRGVSLEVLGREAEAAMAYQAEVEVDPQDVDAIYRHGRILWRQGKYRDAHVWFARALKIGGVPRNLYYYDALSLWHMGRKEASRQRMRRYLAMGGLPEETAKWWGS